MNSALLSACVLVSLVALSQANSCLSFVNNVCRKSKTSSTLLEENDQSHCSAQYEGFPILQSKIRQFVNEHIISSYQYTLMATNFGNYQTNRPGFERLYQKLSDQAWEDTIDLVKYITKRGGYLTEYGSVKESLSLQSLVAAQRKEPFTEYSSLALAMDIQKALTESAYGIHKDAIRQGKNYHDPEISSFIEKEFAHKHADTIRMLSGHMSDLNGVMSDNPDSSLALYLFDEYLQKSLA